MTSTAYFNILSDSIALPNATFNSFVASFGKNSSFVCNLTTSTCIFNDVCSNYPSKLANVYINFGDANRTYVIPGSSLLID